MSCLTDSALSETPPPVNDPHRRYPDEDVFTHSVLASWLSHVSPPSWASSRLAAFSRRWMMLFRLAAFRLRRLLSLRIPGEAEDSEKLNVDSGSSPLSCVPLICSSEMPSDFTAAASMKTPRRIRDLDTGNRKCSSLVCTAQSQNTAIHCVYVKATYNNTPINKWYILLGVQALSATTLLFLLGVFFFWISAETLGSDQSPNP